MAQSTIEVQADWRRPWARRAISKAIESLRGGAKLGDRLLLTGLLLMAVVAVLVPAVIVQERVYVLKLVVVGLLSILPGWIYLEFIHHRGRGLYDEFVINLFRLHIDELGNLPMPPQHTSYYPKWKKAHDEMIEASGKSTKDNIYRRKFENVYGAASVSTYELIHQTNRRRLVHQAETFSPVLMATVVVCLGWVLVFAPEIFGKNFSLGYGMEESARMQIPVALRFGFLGAYAFVLQDLAKRYFRDDLRSAAYISAASRFVFVALIIFAGHVMWPSNLADQEGLFAFMVGFFPLVGLQAIQAAISRPLATLMPSLRTDYPLSELQGLDFWYEARVNEEGVDDMQNLVSANLVDLTLQTRAPIHRIVDWIDQACLHLHIPGAPGRRPPVTARLKDWAKGTFDTDSSSLAYRDNRPIGRLSELGIRTATDLERSFEVLGEDKRFLAAFNRAIGADPTVGSAAIRSILAGLKGEVSLSHVRHFRAHCWLKDSESAESGAM